LAAQKAQGPAVQTQTHRAHVGGGYLPLAVRKVQGVAMVAVQKANGFPQAA
jgi:hypothetical protein